MKNIKADQNSIDKDFLPLEIQREVSRKIRTMGRAGVGAELIRSMLELYAPLAGRSLRDGVTRIKDEIYGPDERNRLDVYAPQNRPGPGMPVLIFVHGGGFVSGDKSEYGNVGYYFARRGILTLVISYRLAPLHQWPSGPEDVAGALKWAALHVEKFGGDPQRIFLMGHSAGAAHTAAYVFLKDFRPTTGNGVSGAILMSGIGYDTRHLSSFQQTYFGQDRARHPAMSVMQQLEDCRLPVFIMYAEFDPIQFDHASIGLFTGLCERSRTAPFIRRLLNHNHISEIRQFNTGDCSVGPDIVEFIHSR
ncbi:MAG: carboxylesterase family protein [Desulfobacterales bacterium]|nr:carboxylesterase family protein [Desulfobacterales bacterium]